MQRLIRWTIPQCPADKLDVHPTVERVHAAFERGELALRVGLSRAPCRRLRSRTPTTEHRRARLRAPPCRRAHGESQPVGRKGSSGGGCQSGSGSNARLSSGSRNHPGTIRQVAQSDGATAPPKLMILRPHSQQSNSAVGPVLTVMMMPVVLLPAHRPSTLPLWAACSLAILFAAASRAARIPRSARRRANRPARLVPERLRRSPP